MSKRVQFIIARSIVHVANANTLKEAMIEGEAQTFLKPPHAINWVPPTRALLQWRTPRKNTATELYRHAGYEQVLVLCERGSRWPLIIIHERV